MKSSLKCLILLFLLALSLQAASLQEVKSALAKSLKANYKGLVIKQLLIKPQGTLQADFAKYSFIGLDANNLRYASGFVKAVFNTPNGEKNLFFRYYLSAHVKALVASKKILRNQDLTPGDYTQKEVGFSNLARDYIYEINTQLVAKRNIRKGKVLRKAYFMPKPLIAKGQRVYGYLSDGGISISIELRALQSGFKGQLIRLKNKEGRTVQGRVVSSFRVDLR